MNAASELVRCQKELALLQQQLDALQEALDPLHELLWTHERRVKLGAETCAAAVEEIRRLRAQLAAPGLPAGTDDPHPRLYRLVWRRRSAWQCMGCRQVFLGPYRDACPNCHHIGYWSGSVDPSDLEALLDAEESTSSGHERISP